MSRRPTRRRTAVDETADDERAYGTDGYWQRRYTARAQGSGLSASAAGVQEDVTYATQARTPDSQTGLLLTRIILFLHRDEWMFGWQQLKPLIAPSLPCAARVLDLGCGTSRYAPRRSLRPSPYPIPNPTLTLTLTPTPTLTLTLAPTRALALTLQQPRPRPRTRPRGGSRARHRRGARLGLGLGLGWVKVRVRVTVKVRVRVRVPQAPLVG